MQRGELRDRWLNSPEWVDEPVPEASYSPRRGRGEGAQEAHADEPLQRRPQWLVDAHDALDAAVAAAYGWLANISDDDALRELLALNGGGQ